MSRIGTDGCARNNDLDMFGEMRTAALLAKAVADDAAAFDAAQRAARGHAGWREGDRASTTASVRSKPGKQADLVCVRLDALETQPLYHVASQLIYATGRHQVSDVWIAGRRKLDDGRLTDMDVAEVRARARAWRERIAAI